MCIFLSHSGMGGGGGLYKMLYLGKMNYIRENKLFTRENKLFKRENKLFKRENKLFIKENKLFSREN